MVIRSIFQMKWREDIVLENGGLVHMGRQIPSYGREATAV